MPTIIDSLVVELGLDASKFDRQQRAAVDSATKSVEEIRRRSSELEDKTSDIGEAFASLGKKALGLFAVFTGAASLTEFVGQTIQAGAAVGRLSRAIGISTNEISRWQGVAREFGSTGEQMAASFQQLANVFTAWQVGGPEAPGIMQIFRAINTEAAKLDATNARTIDSSKGVAQSYLDLAENLRIIHDLAQDKNLASYLAGKIPGMDAGLFDLLIQGSDRLADSLRKVKGYTDEEAEAAGRLQRRWDGLKVSAQNLGLHLLFGAIDSVYGYFHDMGRVATIIGGGKDPGAATFTQPSINATPVGSGFTTAAQKEAFIRAEAAKRGINPDYAMAVARSEGFSAFAGDNGTSFGAFQLHVTPGGRGGAVGDLFRDRTGLDPSDPRNEAATIMFALDWAKSHGWADFHGAANGAHLSSWAGIDRSSTSTSTSYTTEINGPITINAGPNASAGDIAGKLRELGLRRQAQANQSSVGGE